MTKNIAAASIISVPQLNNWLRWPNFNYSYITTEIQLLRIDSYKPQLTFFSMQQTKDCNLIFVRALIRSSLAREALRSLLRRVAIKISMIGQNDVDSLTRTRAPTRESSNQSFTA